MPKAFRYHMYSVGHYYRLAKPGIVYGNLMHVVAGALFVSQLAALNITAIVGVVVGSALMIASGCVVNNICDRGIDARMQRTKTRATVTHEVRLSSAWMYATALLVISVIVLIATTTTLTLIIGLVSYMWYAVLYTYAKYHTSWSTWIGTVPGALPIMAGYTAVSGMLSVTVVLLGVFLLFWQLVHFYAISLFRRDEYAAANVPVISVVKPAERVVRSMYVWAIGYAGTGVSILIAAMLPLAARILLASSSLFWVVYVMTKDRTDIKQWARSVFGSSLLLPFALIVAAVLMVVLA